MVGVPGRSKGCNTCIQRKIKCDQEKPGCGNCRKSNRLCTGYKRRLGYVFSSDVNLADSGESSEQTTVTHQGRWKKCKPPQPGPSTARSVEESPSWSESLLSLSSSGQVSTKAAMRQQYRYICLDHHLPAELLGTHSAKPVAPSNWLVQLQGSGTLSPALETSTAAFFAARVGRMNNDPVLVAQCRSLYVESLKQLQNALTNPQTRFSDETLGACLALSLYELTEPGAGMPSAYRAHINGAITLLRMRGPDANISPLGHSLFLDLRSHEIIISLMQRRESFLSSPEWLERPWKSIPKSPHDELIDWLFSLPAIIRQFDTISETTDRAILRAELNDIIAKYLQIDAVLQGLYKKLDGMVSGPLYWTTLSTLESRLDNDTQGKLFPVSFQFPAFSIAMTVSTYWSNMMVIHIQLMYAYGKLAMVESAETIDTDTDCFLPSVFGNDGSPLATPSAQKFHEHGDRWREMARNICQSVEYFMRTDMGAYGALTILSVLGGCHSCFRNAPGDWSREVGWISEFIYRIKTNVYLPTRNLLQD